MLPWESVGLHGRRKGARRPCGATHGIKKKRRLGYFCISYGSVMVDFMFFKFSCGLVANEMGYACALRRGLGWKAQLSLSTSARRCGHVARRINKQPSPAVGGSEGASARDYLHASTKLCFNLMLLCTYVPPYFSMCLLIASSSLLIERRQVILEFLEIQIIVACIHVQFSLFGFITTIPVSKSTTVCCFEFSLLFDVLHT